eukprot:2067085-Rhodomonas_salina.2
MELARSGTDIRYGATRREEGLRVPLLKEHRLCCYAVCGTEIGYAATAGAARRRRGGRREGGREGERSLNRGSLRMGRGIPLCSYALPTPCHTYPYEPTPLLPDASLCYAVSGSDIQRVVLPGR